MVKNLEDRLSAAPFLLKCYEMVNDESTDELISWNESYNNSFIIWDVARFTSELLSKYFKHSNFASFIRQLNIYGFHKTDTDRWEFSNESFVKGQKNLLKNIVRRKHPQGQGQKKSCEQKGAYSSNTTKEDKKVDLREEVESLKKHKNILMQDLIKVRQHIQNSQSKLILLREQLKGMEKNQQQMLSFIVMAMQNPGIFVKMLHPKESNWFVPPETGGSKKIVTRVDDDDDCERLSTTEGAIVPYQLPMAEEAMESEPDHIIPETSDGEVPMEWYFSDEIRDFLVNMDFNVGQLDDDKLLPLESPSPLVLPDIPYDDDDDDDDGDNLMEQFLLSSPRPDNMESEDHDNEVSGNPEADAVRVW